MDRKIEGEHIVSPFLKKPSLSTAFYMRLSRILRYIRIHRCFLPCDGKHKLDAIDLVDLAGASVAVQRNHVAVRIALAKCMHDSLARDMIRQAAKRLKTYDVGYATLS